METPEEIHNRLYPDMGDLPEWARRVAVEYARQRVEEATATTPINLYRRMVRDAEAYYLINEAQLKSKTKNDEVCAIRTAMMVLIFQNCKATVSEIAGLFNKAHCTLSHHKKRHEENFMHWKAYRNAYTRYKTLINEVTTWEHTN